MANAMNPLGDEDGGDDIFEYMCEDEDEEGPPTLEDVHGCRNPLDYSTMHPNEHNFTVDVKPWHLNQDMRKLAAHDVISGIRLRRVWPPIVEPAGRQRHPL